MPPLINVIKNNIKNEVYDSELTNLYTEEEIDQLDNLGQKWNEEELSNVQGRICEPEEVANAALFLASNESSFVNGETLFVDNAMLVQT